MFQNASNSLYFKCIVVVFGNRKKKSLVNVGQLLPALASTDNLFQVAYFARVSISK